MKKILVSTAWVLAAALVTFICWFITGLILRVYCTSVIVGPNLELWNMHGEVWDLVHIRVRERGGDIADDVVDAVTEICAKGDYLVGRGSEGPFTVDTRKVMAKAIAEEEVAQMVADEDVFLVGTTKVTATPIMEEKLLELVGRNTNLRTPRALWSDRVALLRWFAYSVEAFIIALIFCLAYFVYLTVCRATQ